MVNGFRVLDCSIEHQDVLASYVIMIKSTVINHAQIGNAPLLLPCQVQGELFA